MSTKSLAALAIAIRFDGDGSPHLSVPLWEKGTVVGSTTPRSTAIADSSTNQIEKRKTALRVGI